MTTVLEELSGKKLAGVIALFLVALVGFFIAGGVGPSPTASHVLLFRGCAFPGKTSKVLSHPVDSSNCPLHVDRVEKQGENLPDTLVVYYAKLPLDRAHVVMSRWFQWIGSSFRIELSETLKKDFYGSVGFTARIYYGNLVKEDKEADKYKWENLTAKINFDRDVECTIANHGCDDVPFFELLSSHHKYYLINLRHVKGLKNRISDIWFSVIHWQPSFVKTTFAIKTILTPVMFVALIWFGRKVFGKGRQSWLVERLIFYLGLSLILLNFPIDWISLWADAPWLNLWSDIRQGLFYCMLVTFWLLFVSEQFYGEDRITSVKKYWSFLAPILLTFAAALVYGLIERGNIIRNPFFTYWGKKSSAYALWVFFVVVSCIFAFYVLVLLILIALAFRKLRNPATTMQPGSVARRLRNQGVSYRLKFLLAATLLTIVLTGVSYITQIINEAEWKHRDNKTIEVSGALYTGVYGLWNLYTLAVMILYAPAKSKVEDDDTSIDEDIPLAKADSLEHRRRNVPAAEDSNTMTSF